MKELTEQQRKVLEVIKDYIKEKGVPPSTRDVAQAMGFPFDSGAKYYLDVLIKKGAIERIPGVSRRSIRVVDG